MFLFLAGIILTFCVLYPIITEKELFGKIDYKVYDHFINLLPRKQVSDIITLVEIDDASLKEEGQWPWPRYKIARMLANISSSGAASTGIDIIFPEEDRTSIKIIRENLQKDFDVDIQISNLPPALNDNDTYLEYILSRGPFVLSSYMMFGKDTDPGTLLDEKGIQVNDLTDKETFHQANGMMCSLPRLSQAATATGFFNSQIDSDGITRRIPVIIKYRSDVYTSLALMTYATAVGVGEMEIKNSIHGLTAEINGQKLPLNDDGTVLLNFRNDKQSYKRYSAHDVLRGKFSPRDFRGKIVLVGATAAGMNDVHSTSSGFYSPGLDVHATFIDNLVNGDFFRIPKWAKFASVLTIVLFGIVISLVAGKVKSQYLILMMPVITALVGITSYIELYKNHIYLSPAPTILSLIFIWFIVIAINFYLEEKKSYRQALDISQTQELIIRSMASVAETRDPETGAHIRRTQDYVKILVNYLAQKGLFANELDKESINYIYLSAPLHDVGKVGIRDEILLKPKDLNYEEFEIMKTHTILGSEIIRRAEQQSPTSSKFLEYGRLIALTHHEKWDGNGYPYGIRGEEIPLCGRLMAVADVYDALISKRHYKDIIPHEHAMKIIRKGRGTHFDPVIVDAFLDCEQEILTIVETYRSMSSA